MVTQSWKLDECKPLVYERVNRHVYRKRNAASGFGEPDDIDELRLELDEEVAVDPELALPVGRVGCCSPRQGVQFTSRDEGSKYVGLADIARHVIGCYSTQDT